MHFSQFKNLTVIQCSTPIMDIFKILRLDIVTIFFYLAMPSFSMAEFALRQCEPIKIEMCRNIGYNETSMPNLVGNELQSEAEYTLQTFSPLIEYVCSSQLKLFLCATYVPMCTPKVPLPIGPCRTLCESVRSRCHPVLQGFGYPWPPALDCNRFPKENNHETMCMEGPGETLEPSAVNEMYPAYPAAKTPFLPTTISTAFECPGHSKLYVKLHRSGRCAPLCDANILFGPNEKHVAELWIHTWTYASVTVALLAIICLLCYGSQTSKSQDRNQIQILKPLMWSHTFVAIGWIIRFIAGRTTTSCGFDPQLPNVSLLLVDGLSNGSCASTFILRYYFGMAACAWWAILCLGWHRNVRSVSPDELGHMSLNTNVYSHLNINNGVTKLPRSNTSKTEKSITSNNLARFLAWGLPAFQTAAVIVARLVDADELLGACYVGNQSDKGLQILVATPLFCYWIFGSMNLASGYLVYRRNKDILRNTNSTSIKLLLQTKCSISGVFLFIYCLPYALLLLAVIYEFANIDVWLSESPYNQAPIWSFLTRAFMELFLGIICSISILGPKISSIYKRKLSSPPTKLQQPSIRVVPKYDEQKLNCNSRMSTKSYSNTSYQTVKEHRQPTLQSKKHSSFKVSAAQAPNYSSSRSKISQGHSHILMNKLPQTYGNNPNSQSRFGDETIL